MGAVHKKRVVRRHTERTLRELNAPSEYWHRQSPELLVKLAVKERGLSPWVEPTQIKDYRAITKILRRVYWYRDMAKNQAKMSNTPKGVRVRKMMEDWSADIRSINMSAAVAPSALPEGMFGGLLQRSEGGGIVSSCLCGLAAVVPVAVLTGMAAARAISSTK